MATNWLALAAQAYAQRHGRNTDTQQINPYGNAIGEDPRFPQASMVIDPVTGEGKYLLPDGTEVPYPGVGHQEPPHPPGPPPRGSGGGVQGSPDPYDPWAYVPGPTRTQQTLSGTDLYSGGGPGTLAGAGQSGALQQPINRNLLQAAVGTSNLADGGGVSGLTGLFGGKHKNKLALAAAQGAWG